MSEFFIQSKEFPILKMSPELQNLLNSKISNVEIILFSCETTISRKPGLSNNCAQIVTDNQLILAQTNLFISMNYLETSQWDLWADHLAIKEYGSKYGYSRVNTIFLREITGINSSQKNIKQTKYYLERIIGKSDEKLEYIFGSPETSSRFQEIVRSEMINIQGTPTNNNPSTHLQRLRELQILLAEGIINEKEYENKRVEILRDI